jgi:hypothetical protein
MFRRNAAAWFAAAICAAGVVRPALANSITFTAAVGDRAATTKFDTSGSDLIVTLQNASAADVLEPTYVLTALFFDVSGPRLNLTRASAVVPPGSTVSFGGTDPDGVVGGEWAYLEQLSGAPLGAGYGISSTGLGLFGPGDLFPGTNLQGPASPDGLQYGITSAGDVASTGNAAVTGNNALIQDTVVFTLSGLPNGFDPSLQIQNVVWQYGTSLDDAHIPEPGAMGLLCVAAIVAARRRMPG